MDGNRFDDLSRTFASKISRRRAVTVIAGGLAGALGFRVSADAQNQVPCGNEFCAHDPGVCNPGCVCCLYYNPIIKRVINSRCRPPGSCSPADVRCPSGQVYDPTRGCVTPQATTTTTTTTTAQPTTTTTTTTTTTEPPCGGSCPDGLVCCNGECRECCADSDCDDGIDCTDDFCENNVCTHYAVDFLCGVDTQACEQHKCRPEQGGCVVEDFNDYCPEHQFACMRLACDPGQGCFHYPDDSLCPPSDNYCTVSTCTPTHGCVMVPRICPIPIDASDCFVTFCDPVDQVCKSEPDHSACPESETKYNCEVPFCTGGPHGGCGFQTLCTSGQNGCQVFDEQHGCICTDQFVVGGSCVNSGPQ